jgi:hypothetical protein
MRFRYLLLIVLILITWIAASSCSSLGVALDTSYVGESYDLDKDRNDISYEETLQVLPKLVLGKEMLPLIDIKFAKFSFGFDYEIYYYGYDTPRLISDVINNKRSLSDAIEYPSKEVGGKNNLNLFSFSPQFYFNSTDVGTKNLYLGYGIGFPLYTSISMNKEKYKIKEEGNDQSFIIGYNWDTGTMQPKSFLIKYSSKNLRIQKMNSSEEEEELNYSKYSLIYRYYL